MRLLAALLLSACVPSPPASLSGVWLVELSDAASPEPVLTTAFHVAIAQSNDRVVGLGYIGRHQLLLDGLCTETGCLLRAVLGAGEEQSIMFWRVRPSPFGWEGTARGSGITAGIVRGRLAREDDL